nr:putative reverse transcriptase domain-containing protein [Tanacetum cinerariifolium]
MRYSVHPGAEKCTMIYEAYIGCHLFHIKILEITIESFGNTAGSEYRLPSQNRWPKRCRTPIAWTEVGEGKLLGPEIVQETTDKIVQIKERLKRSKLSPRYVGPFEIIERIGPVAYRLRLPQELVGVHETFHVSNVKKCLADVNLHVPLGEVKVDNKLHFVEEPIEILNHEVKRLKRRWIPIVKVCWNSRRGPEFTWEREVEMKRKYPHLFASATVGGATENSGRNSL